MTKAEALAEALLQALILRGGTTAREYPVMAALVAELAKPPTQLDRMVCAHRQLALAFNPTEGIANG